MSQEEAPLRSAPGDATLFQAVNVSRFHPHQLAAATHTSDLPERLLVHGKTSSYSMSVII